MHEKTKKKIMELVSLEGKIAMITGAASGIGKGTAILLAEAGADIILLDINEPQGIKVEREIQSLPRRSKFIKCDVRSDSDCCHAVASAVKEFGRIDILFNNAGIAIRKNTVTLSEEEWDLALDVNLKGTFLLSRHVIPRMIESGGGSIINTGSGWSLKGGPDAVSYCASKAGILNLTRAMAIDHGKHNIRVNCVCPGDVDTPLLHGECDQLREDKDVFMKAAADRPLNRVGTPQDVAHAVLFFAGGLSTWITGSFLVVDGGGLA